MTTIQLSLQLDQIEAIGRIICLISAYRQATDDHQTLFLNESINTHLKQGLSIADWILWQRMKRSEQVAALLEKPAILSLNDYGLLAEQCCQLGA